MIRARPVGWASRHTMYDADLQRTITLDNPDPRRPLLVTGGAGFVGSHACKALIAGGKTIY
jgi:hypothetical protein